MADFNLFDVPDYYGGLLGEQATQDLQKKALTTGLVNAALGFIAQPRNQRYGSVLPYLGKALTAGYESGQNVIAGGLRDYETQQKIAEMKRQQEQRAAQQQYINTLPENVRSAATAFPELGAKYAESVINPPKKQYTILGNQLLETSGETPTVAYTGPEKPEPKSDTIKQYEYAVGQGYKGSFEDWAKALTPYQLAQLGISQAQLQSALITAGLQQQKTLQDISTAKVATEGAIASFDTALNSIKDLKTHPGLSVAVGASAQPGFQFIPGTDKANFYAKLDTLKAQVFLPQVQQLRGLGALSENEGKKLTDSIGALSTMMSEKEFRKSLNDIEVSLTQAKQRTQRSLQGGDGATQQSPAKKWNSATGKWE